MNRLQLTSFIAHNRLLRITVDYYHDYVSLCGKYFISSPYCLKGAFGRAVMAFAGDVIFWFHDLCRPMWAHCGAGAFTRGPQAGESHCVRHYPDLNSLILLHCNPTTFRSTTPPSKTDDMRPWSGWVLVYITQLYFTIYNDSTKILFKNSNYNVQTKTKKYTHTNRIHFLLRPKIFCTPQKKSLSHSLWSEAQ